VNGDAVEFDQLAGTDLVLDRIYRGGTFGGTRDDPLSQLLPVGNQGGFDVPVAADPSGELGGAGLAGGQAGDGVDGDGPPFSA
jgi:hypothetical protein